MSSIIMRRVLKLLRENSGASRPARHALTTTQRENWVRIQTRRDRYTVGTHICKEENLGSGGHVRKLPNRLHKVRTLEHLVW